MSQLLGWGVDKNVGEVFVTELHSHVFWHALSKCVGRVKDAKDGFMAD